MQNYSISPFAFLRTIRNNRVLILDLAKRDALGRYKGSVFGSFWSFITPVFLLAIYTFVFSEIFKARWTMAEADASKTRFAIVLFAGMIVFNFFSEVVNRAPSLILNNPNFVKKVVFPLELLSCVNLLSALYHALISVIVLLLFQLAINFSCPWTVALFPLILFPFTLITLGVSWLLSAVGVYLRDIGQVISVFVTGLMFLSPVFFPLSAIPVHWQEVARWNPLVLPIEMARQVLVFGQIPDFISWLVYTCIAALFAWAGYAAFQKARKGFADVL